MATNRRILIGVDSTVHSANALKWTLDNFPPDRKNELHLVHVENPGQDGKNLQEKRSFLVEMENHIRERFPNAKEGEQYFVRREHGKNAASVLNDYGKQNQCGVVVVGERYSLDAFGTRWSEVPLGLIREFRGIIVVIRQTSLFSEARPLVEIYGAQTLFKDQRLAFDMKEAEKIMERENVSEESVLSPESSGEEEIATALGRPAKKRPQRLPEEEKEEDRARLPREQRIPEGRGVDELKEPRGKPEVSIDEKKEPSEKILAHEKELEPKEKSEQETRPSKARPIEKKDKEPLRMDEYGPPFDKKPEAIERPEKGRRPGAIERPEKSGRPEAIERPEKEGRPEAIEHPERGGRPEREQKPEAIERPEKGRRPGAIERPEKEGRPGAIERPEKEGRPEAIEHPERGGRPEREEKPEAIERPERGGKPEAIERPEKGGRPGAIERPEKEGRPEAIEHPEREGKPEYFKEIPEKEKLKEITPLQRENKEKMPEIIQPTDKEREKPSEKLPQYEKEHEEKPKTFPGKLVGPQEAKLEAIPEKPKLDERISKEKIAEQSPEKEIPGHKPFLEKAAPSVLEEGIPAKIVPERKLGMEKEKHPVIPKEVEQEFLPEKSVPSKAEKPSIKEPEEEEPSKKEAAKEEPKKPKGFMVGFDKLADVLDETIPNLPSLPKSKGKEDEIEAPAEKTIEDIEREPESKEEFVLPIKKPEMKGPIEETISAPTKEPERKGHIEEKLPSKAAKAPERPREFAARPKGIIEEQGGPLKVGKPEELDKAPSLHEQVDRVPERAKDISKTLEKIPDELRQIPERAEKISKDLDDILERAKANADLLAKERARLKEPPEELEEACRVISEIPKQLAQVSDDLREVPERAKAINDQIENIQDGISELPKNMQEISDKLKELPRREIPETIRTIPEKGVEGPEEISEREFEPKKVKKEGIAAEIPHVIKKIPEKKELTEELGIQPEAKKFPMEQEARPKESKPPEKEMEKPIVMPREVPIEKMPEAIEKRPPGYEQAPAEFPEKVGKIPSEMTARQERVPSEVAKEAEGAPSEGTRKVERVPAEAPLEPRKTTSEIMREPEIIPTEMATKAEKEISPFEKKPEEVETKESMLPKFKAPSKEFRVESPLPHGEEGRMEPEKASRIPKPSFAEAPQFERRPEIAERHMPPIAAEEARIPKMEEIVKERPLGFVEEKISPTPTAKIIAPVPTSYRSAEAQMVPEEKAAPRKEVMKKPLEYLEKKGPGKDVGIEFPIEPEFEGIAPIEEIQEKEIPSTAMEAEPYEAKKEPVYAREKTGAPKEEDKISSREDILPDTIKEAAPFPGKVTELLPKTEEFEQISKVPTHKEVIARGKGAEAMPPIIGKAISPLHEAGPSKEEHIIPPSWDDRKLSPEAIQEAESIKAKYEEVRETPAAVQKPEQELAPKKIATEKPAQKEAIIPAVGLKVAEPLEHEPQAPASKMPSFETAPVREEKKYEEAFPSLEEIHKEGIPTGEPVYEIPMAEYPKEIEKPAAPAMREVEQKIPTKERKVPLFVEKEKYPPTEKYPVQKEAVAPSTAKKAESTVKRDEQPVPAEMKPGILEKDFGIAFPEMPKFQPIEPVLLKPEESVPEVGAKFGSNSPTEFFTTKPEALPFTDEAHHAPATDERIPHAGGAGKGPTIASIIRQYKEEPTLKEDLDETYQMTIAEGEITQPKAPAQKRGSPVEPAAAPKPAEAPAREHAIDEGPAGGEEARREKKKGFWQNIVDSIPLIGESGEEEPSEAHKPLVEEPSHEDEEAKHKKTFFENLLKKKSAFTKVPTASGDEAETVHEEFVEEHGLHEEAEAQGHTVEAQRRVDEAEKHAGGSDSAQKSFMTFKGAQRKQ